MRRRPILYVTTAGTVIFNLLAIITGLSVALTRNPSGTWVSLSRAAFSFGIAFLCLHIFLRRSQRNNSGSSQRGRKH